MADDDEQRDERNATDETQPDSMVIEGLRPPLTREQRRRRMAITAVVIAGALLVLLWPAISAFGGALPSAPLLAQATATPEITAQGMLEITSATIVVGVSDGAECPVTPQTPSSLGLPEMQANARGGEVWALLLSGPSIHANSATMIAWRAGGSGAFQVVANGPNGEQLPPSSGPDAHGGSNWDRPGDEWGTSFTFPQPGCWQLLVTRGASLSADLWLLVSA